MLFQFIKQNKIYLITFTLYWLYNFLISTALYKLIHLNNNFGDESLSLPSSILSGIYNFVITCGTLHFAVFVFYKYKDISFNKSAENK